MHAVMKGPLVMAGLTHSSKTLVSGGEYASGPVELPTTGASQLWHRPSISPAVPSSAVSYRLVLNVLQKVGPAAGGATAPRASGL